MRRWGATNEVEAMMTLRWRSATVEAEEAMATAMGSAAAWRMAARKSRLTMGS